MVPENRFPDPAGIEPSEDGYLGPPSLAERIEATGPSRADQEATERSEAKGKLPPRPYFIPPGFSISEIPQEMQKGLFEILQPCYDELVLGASTSLERQAGASLTFMLFLELLEQYDLGMLAENLRRSGGIGDSRDKQIDRYLRLVKSKQNIANFIARLQDASLLGRLRRT
jgi:hypothetical protein